MADKDNKTPPIRKQDYIAGVKVVNLGEYRIARGRSHRPSPECKHHNQVYDLQERRIWCEDCENDIEPFDAFVSVIQAYDKALKKLRSGWQELEESKKHNIISRATKKLDEAFRRKTMTPCCPHCKHDLLPEDFANGIAMFVSRELARQRRKSKANPQK